MSTTIEVYPARLKPPSFRQVLELSQAELWRFLERHAGIVSRPVISVMVLKNKNHRQCQIDLDAPAVWPNDTYAWFTIGRAEGGTDCYFRTLSELNHECWAENLTDEKFHTMAPRISDCLRTGHYWYFRRSVGQPGIVCVAYGIIAASLAVLTDGFLFSGDSAWEWRRFPAEPSDFLEWYFDPEKAIEEEYRKWAQQCILGLKEDLEER